MMIILLSFFLVLGRIVSGKLSFVLTNTVLTFYINCRLVIVLQDALLSLELDQSPTAQEMSLQSHLPSLCPKPFLGERLDYRQAMNWLCHLTLRYAKSEAGSSDVSNLYALFQDLHHLNIILDYHLEPAKACISIQQL
jgi:hypothetical protein